MKLAIIPARGGSKRIPRKNIKNFLGKPIIAWSIEIAKLSGCFDKIIVSTDDAEIAEVSAKYGADIPFIRPKELSDDFATTSSVIAHAVNLLMEYDSKPEYICCLYPTAPLLRIKDLQLSLDMIKTLDCDYVFSATPFPYPVQRGFKLSFDKSVELLNPEYADSRSQDLEEVYHDAGQFYWGTADAWLTNKSIFLSRASAFILPSYRVVDIDTEEDWERAELAFRIIKGISR